VLEQRTHAADRTAGAEDVFLKGEVKVRFAGVLLAQMTLDRLRQVVQVHDEVAHAGGEERLHGPRDERPVAQRHHRLRHGVRDGAQARAEARGEDHPFHGEGSCSGGKTMFSGRSARVRRCWR
jgi:hypothetical protein